MKCPLCKKEVIVDAFDTAVEHIIIVFDVSGTAHVHGPIKNEFIMRRAVDVMIAEMEKNGVKYNPAVQDRIET